MSPHGWPGTPVFPPRSFYSCSCLIHHRHPPNNTLGVQCQSISKRGSLHRPVAGMRRMMPHVSIGNCPSLCACILKLPCLAGHVFCGSAGLANSFFIHGSGHGFQRRGFLVAFRPPSGFNIPRIDGFFVGNPNASVRPPATGANDGSYKACIVLIPPERNNPQPVNLPAVRARTTGWRR